MKNTIVILTIVLMLGCCQTTLCQKISIISPLQKEGSVAADIKYGKEFGNMRNDKLGIPFPYNVIAVELVGTNRAGVAEAKQKLGLDVGSNYRVKSRNTDTENCILFLVPMNVANVYLLCGDGCERQTLCEGWRMENNRVYKCKIKYLKEGNEESLVTLNCGVPEAHWIIDNKDINTGSVKSCMLTKGEHRIELKAEGFYDYSTTVTIKDSVEHLTFSLTKIPQYGTLNVNVKPNNSIVLLDDIQIGRTPLTTDEVTVGPHKVSIVMSGHNTKYESIYVTKGGISTVRGRLTKIKTERPKKSYTERKTGFQYFMDLNANITQSHWGIGIDMIFANRIKSFYSLGGGVGVNSLLNLNYTDYNVFATLYVDNKFFIPTTGDVFPMLDLAIGCDFGFLGINKSHYNAFTLGVYGRAGIGLETSGFFLSTGCEFMGTHTIYLKIGFTV